MITRRRRPRKADEEKRRKAAEKCFERIAVVRESKTEILLQDRIDGDIVRLVVLGTENAEVRISSLGVTLPLSLIQEGLSKAHYENYRLKRIKSYE